MRAVAYLVLAAGLAGAAQKPSEAFDKAVGALSSGDYTAAEAGFREVLQTAPNHVDALRNLGVVLARTGRPEQAIAVYRRALELSPGNTSVLLNVGLVYMRQKSYADALSVFQTLIREDPESLPARDIRLLFPLCDGYLKQDQTPEAGRKVAALLAGVPEALASLVRCKLAYQNERLDEAARQCRRVLETDPRFAGAHLALARVLLGQHSPEAARELAAAIAEKPTDPEDLYDLGVALLQEGRIEEATRYLEAARRLEPDFWGSYFHLGKIKLQLDQPGQAVPLLQKAADLNPSSFSLFYELGRALKLTGKTEEAQRAMQRVRELMALDLEKDAKALGKR
jgi:superkiller protein 3